jgi:hypothetical protein
VVTRATKATQLGEDQSNDAANQIAFEEPYAVSVTVRGVSPIIFHRYSVESVEAKGRARKGSAAKKTDDIESYVYRNSAGEISIPGSYLKGAIAGPQGAAKYRQDPRSPRKSALDLYKAGVIVTTDLASLGTTNWDYLDTRRVLVQRSAISRVRPAMTEGWETTFDLLVQSPEYINSDELHDVIINAGKLVGLGDFRPTYGRFQVTKFET